MQNWHERLEREQKKFNWLSELKDQQSCWMPLDNFALIIIEGPDAEKFLQGQCTCNIERCRDQQFLLGAHCNPQGRMLSSFVILQLSEQKFALRLHQSIAEQALADLKKYIVFSKAKIFIEDNYLIAGIYRPNFSPLLNQLGVINADNSNFTAGEFQATPNGLVLCLNHDQYELWIHHAIVDQQMPFFSSETLLPAHQWDLLNIRRGIAEVREQTRTKLLPQEMNFQLTDGVSFNKGCYTGQEVIARIHYKAKLKKHMYRGSTTTQDAIEPNTALMRNNKTVGSIILTAPASSCEYEVLSLCHDNAANDNNVHVDTASPSILRWQPLPYAIPT